MIDPRLTASGCGCCNARRSLNERAIYARRHHPFTVCSKTLERTRPFPKRFAKRLGISLGKVNFCLICAGPKKAAIKSQFRNSENKLAYAYLLTRAGWSKKRI